MLLSRGSSSVGHVAVRASRLIATARPRVRPCTVRPYSSGVNSLAASSAKPAEVTIRGQSYKTAQDWYNVSPVVLEATSRQLHLQQDHPISITRQIIESSFPAPTYTHHANLHPVVSTHQNFDSLGFPPNHPGRALSDTYYINENTLLRTHTSAHQADKFRTNLSEGYLVTADVYRRDAIDRSHFPAFHQMEGARSWDRTKVPGGDVAAAVRKDIDSLPKHDITVEDLNPPVHAENPLQTEHHSEAEAVAIGEHLKRSLESMVVNIFTRAKAAALKANPDFVDEPLRMRWVDAYFPFTSPSWELEVYYAGDWLEVLGCGVVKQDIYINAGVPSQLGWAFGVGIDRIAMLLFKIPDIRLFWSQDERFLSQFRGVSQDLDKLRLFTPFSKYPSSPRDVSFWVPTTSSAAGGNTKGSIHENDIMELVRNVAGDKVEDVRLFDEFVHPKTGRKSMAYRIVYRSLERTLTNAEVQGYHDEIGAALVREYGVELRK
ncbi:hypothetical protein S40288_06401 [Stachybotrys chartarum IBT 40288]|nr:hypothetical protein S40288_06401 [Stachybotrys chartarum IBT 40288]